MMMREAMKYAVLSVNKNKILYGYTLGTNEMFSSNDEDDARYNVLLTSFDRIPF